jgi:AbrB family looped-hinge helix DNA binding protein
MPYVSKLSAKGQVTIPAELRKALKIEAGDLVGYELKGRTVALRKVDPFDAAYHAAVGETLGEWNSPEDEEAFDDL